jgi:MATE family multidrug resistance protein
MLANFFAYWLIGLPLGALMCFKLAWGAVGMWIGLCLALVMIGSVLALVWRWTIHDMVFPPVPAAANSGV